MGDYLNPPRKKHAMEILQPSNQHALVALYSGSIFCLNSNIIQSGELMSGEFEMFTLNRLAC